MKTDKPKQGGVLTMALDYWRDDAKKGAKVEVVKSRKKKLCASGLKIWVKTSGGKVLDLDARWFSEYGETFSYKG